LWLHGSYSNKLDVNINISGTAFHRNQNFVYICI